MPDMIYDSARLRVLDGTIDLDSHMLKLALLAATYEPDAAHATWADVSAHEVAGAGYVAGGKPLANVALTQTGAVVALDADDAAWTGSSLTARYAVLYDATATNSPLIRLFDFGADKSSDGGAFEVVFSSTGILALS